MRNQRLLLSLSLLLALGLPVSAQQRPAKPAAAAKAKTEKTLPPAEKQSVTHHSVTINGTAINYTATAGTLLLHNKKEEPIASIFYVAYRREGVTDLSRRPLTFLYNGGPGSASIWLHMGAFGPRRVQTTDARHTPPAPYRLVDNDNSLLDKSDLVFIDPVGTGFSKAVGKGKGKEFWGVDQDVRSLADFIRLYVTRNGRWNSPKFLLGESYGTTRSAALVNYLQNSGMEFNGVVLVSSILNFETASFNTGNDLPYVLYIPSYAAVAWYHDKLPNKPKNLDSFLDTVREFALKEYSDALMRGASLGEAERADVLKKLSEYTGISQSFYTEADLRLLPPRFEKELMRGERKTVGRLDARFTGIDHDAAGEFPEYDPASSSIGGAFTALFNRYVRSDLKFDSDDPYVTSSRDANRNWDWKHGGGRRFGWPGYLNVGEDLRQAISKNPQLKVLVANGYFDLATPFFATEYTMDHLGLEKSLQKNVRLSYYQAGHMMYLHPEALKKLKSDVARFYDSTLSR